MIKEKSCLYDVAPIPREETGERVKKEFGLSEVCRLCANENPLGPPASAVKAMGVAAAKGGVFPDNKCEDLRLALGEILDVNYNEMFFSTGEYGGVADLIWTFMDKEDEIIVPQPYFNYFQSITGLADGIVKGIPLNDDYVVDLPAMVGAITGSTKAIYIPNPSDPGGTVIHRRSLLQMLHRIGEIGRDILVILDESYIQYAEYEDDDAAVDGIRFVRDFPNVVVLRSFSHCYGLAGLSLGFGIAPKDIVAQVNKVIRPYTVTTIAQAGALAALYDKEHLDKTIEFNKVERDILSLSLQAMGLKVSDSKANFLLVDVGIDAGVVTKALMSRGVMVKSGDVFGFPNSIRVSVGLQRENEIFLNALREILAK